MTQATPTPANSTDPTNSPGAGSPTMPAARVASLAQSAAQAARARVSDATARVSSGVSGVASRAATVMPGQSRRGPSAVSSGRGERIADIFIGGSLVAGGVSLALRRRFLLGAPLVAGGAWFLSAAATGRFSPYAALGLVRADSQSGSGLVVDRAITIARPRTVVYAYWRDLTHLPQFMPDLLAVTQEGDHSHWVATAPITGQVEWDAQITEERPGELLAWQSLPGASVENGGEVRFRDAPGGRGTEVRARLIYQPPMGTAGAALARIFQKEPSQQVDESLRRLKAIMEAGEAPRVDGQPDGRHKDMAD